VLGLVALTIVSASWSAAPDTTLMRGFALAGTSLFALWLSARYSLAQQLKLLAWALVPIVLWCLYMAATFPGSLIFDDFTGIFEHKNVLGRAMTLSTLVFLFTAWTHRRRAGPFLFAALSVILLIIAKSATALVVLLTLLGLIPLFRILKQDSRIAIVLGIIAVLAAGVGLLFAASHITVLTSILGRDATLTGRTELWPMVIDMIGKRPVLGYGYEAFWLKDLSLRIAVDEGAGWRAQHSHNGFLEVALAMGLLGLTVYVIGLVRGIARALRWMRAQEGITAQWPLLFLCFFVLYNLTEVTALARNSIYWALYVSALTSVAPRVIRSSKAARPLEPAWPVDQHRWDKAPAAVGGETS
jgi:O-antigen ligase